jgi:hypothetical protein
MPLLNSQLCVSGTRDIRDSCRLAVTTDHVATYAYIKQSKFSLAVQIRLQIIHIIYIFIVLTVQCSARDNS